MIRLAFDPQVVFDVQIPKYKVDDSPLGLEYNSLYQEYRRFYLFQPAASHVPIAKKQSILADILESVHATEAMLIERIFNRDMSDYNLTEETVRAAYPDLLSPPMDPPVTISADTAIIKPKRGRKKKTTTA